jgi:hypothetical protein
MSNNFDTLQREIIALSVADTWDKAVKEWSLNYIEMLDEAVETCLCEHYPLKELCFLMNHENGYETMVGNVCVNRFMGIDSESIFRGFKRIMKDPTKAASVELADYAYSSHLIDEWEHTFLEDTVALRRLSLRQANKRHEINTRLVKTILRPTPNKP